MYQLPGIYYIRIIYIYIYMYVLVKAPLQVCMENTARGMCRETNTARGKAECCICLETSPSAVFFVYTCLGGALTVI